MDKEQRAKLLQDRFTETFFNHEGLWAIYEGLAKRKRRMYPSGFAPGSLCELEMIEGCFPGKRPIGVHVLSDEWPVEKLDEKGLQWAGTNTGQSLDGEQFLIEKSDYKSPRHGREVRSVKAWSKFQKFVMRGCRKPWIKKQRNDPDLPILEPPEYVQANFLFQDGMGWSADRGHLLQSEN